jgi:hypothetical protein
MLNARNENLSIRGGRQVIPRIKTTLTWQFIGEFD